MNREARRRTVLFGGYAGPALPRDTWEWDGTTWLPISSAVSPPYTPDASMIYDRDRRRVVLRLFDGTLWDWDGQTWREVETTNGAPSNSAVLAYHTALRQTLVFGLTDQTWVLSYAGLATEACEVGGDRDNDGLQGCADPDCWGRCSPDCAPGVVGCTPTTGCGDGTCSSLESSRLCPLDCGPRAVRCGDFECAMGVEDTSTCPGDCPPP